MALGFTPLLALAQPQTTGTFVGCTGIGLGTIEGIICKIGVILNFVVPILITLAVIVFVWGVFVYVIASDEEAKTTGRNRMIFGLIGLLVIVAVWGLVRLLANTFLGPNATGQQTIVFPSVPF